MRELWYSLIAPRALCREIPGPDAALVAALHSGHLGGASLDVYPQEPLPPEHPLWTCPNVLLTPHTSGFRQGHWEEVVDLFAENLERFEREEHVRFRVEPELGY